MNVYKGRLLKKIFKSKFKACPVNTGHYMAFKHWISFATDLAANFGCNWFRITPDIVYKLLRAAIWSRCAVLFNALSSDRSSIQTCCFAQDSIRNMLLCSYVIFLFRDQCMIERFSEAMGAALVGNNYSPIPGIPSKFLFHMKKEKVTRRCPKFTKHWNLVDSWTESVVVACFPQGSLSLPAATAAESETHCVCARPSDPRKQSSDL